MVRPIQSSSLTVSQLELVDAKLEFVVKLNGEIDAYNAAMKTLLPHYHLDVREGRLNVSYGTEHAAFKKITYFVQNILRDTAALNSEEAKRAKASILASYRKITRAFESKKLGFFSNLFFGREKQRQIEEAKKLLQDLPFQFQDFDKPKVVDRRQAVGKFAAETFTQMNKFNDVVERLGKGSYVYVDLSDLAAYGDIFFEETKKRGKTKEFSKLSSFISRLLESHQVTLEDKRAILKFYQKETEKFKQAIKVKGGFFDRIVRRFANWNFGYKKLLKKAEENIQKWEKDLENSGKAPHSLPPVAAALPIVSPADDKPSSVPESHSSRDLALERVEEEKEESASVAGMLREDDSSSIAKESSDRDSAAAADEEDKGESVSVKVPREYAFDDAKDEEFEEMYQQFMTRIRGGEKPE